MKKRIVKFIEQYRLALIALIILFASSIIVLYPTFTEKLSSTIWDGSVATTFNGGSGTETDPYLINDGSQLAYLQSLISNDQTYALYFNKYYKITNNINLDGLTLNSIGNYNLIFSGSLNGDGYTISNGYIGSSNLDTSSIKTYGLFGYLRYAKVSNLNLTNIKIDGLNIDANTDAGIISGIADSSTISNIAINGSYINGNNLTNVVNVGGIFGLDNGSNSIINLSVDFNSNLEANKGLLFGLFNNASLNTIIIKNNGLNLASNYNVINDNTLIYTLNDNGISFTNNYSLNSVVELLDSHSPSYDWTIRDNAFIIKNNGVEEVSGRMMLRSINTGIVAHDSGVEGNTVYVNDFVADFNYYNGLNFTNNSGTLPSTENKNIYTDNNLVYVAMTYSGSDSTGTYTGTVSPDESQNKYVYYKVYAVNDNGTSSNQSDDYIDVELIDNPFTVRPTDMAFNGWVTDYSGAKLSYDSNYYVRYVKIPVTYTNNKPSDININMFSSWTYSKQGLMSGNWNTAFSNLDTAGMKQLNLQDIITYLPYDMAGYFHRITISRYTYYSGYYNVYGTLYNSGYCNNRNGCTVYQIITNEYYTEGSTYYSAESGYMTQVTAADLTFEIDTITPNPLKNGSMAGYYRSVTIPYSSSLKGYYTSDGNMMTSGTCTTSGGCSYYELIQYYNLNGNVENYVNGNTYYYLATRDTNIILLQSNVTSMWSSSYTKPFTLTAYYNGNDYRSSSYLYVNNTYIKCYADTVIENLEIYTTTSFANDYTASSSTTTSRYFYGNFFNVKIGRGITSYNNYVNFIAFNGGSNSETGSSSNPTKFRFIVESGKYNGGMLVSGGDNYYSNDIYTEAQAIYGNDYDRVTSNNTNFIVYSCVAAYWGGNIYSGDNNTPAVTSIYKSGSYGYGKYDNVTGTYIGGRQSGNNYAARKGIIEGGWFYNVIGGPITDSSRETYNDLYLYVKGGDIQAIWGGAGRTATYGNRIIQMTGGLVNNSVFGGSCAASGSEGEGTVNGTSYVYIGGNAQVGSESYYNNNTIYYGAESGSVFGNGDGRSGSSTIGSNDNSIVIIDGDAKVLRNIYGGGNYGATGVSSNGTTSYSNIILNGGTINGSVYGGGNNNGAGSTSITSTINITMNDGYVGGSIYGGSRTLGTVYGSTNVNVLNGTVNTDVYGGGEGGYASSSNVGTFVRDNVNVVIGSTLQGPNITGSVYGGSAYGTVNATTYNASSNSDTVNVTINNGNITTAVYGGAKGNGTYTPYVKGNITVNINGGIIGSVYGGFDQAGSPQGTDVVYLNGGIIGSSFGGGNNTSIASTNIYLQGATTTYLYGGSNQSGTVNTSNVYIKSGTVTSAFGGNNIGGTMTKTNVIVTGGTIGTELYGGGNAVATDTTSVIFNKADNKVPYVFGGGKSADASITNVEVNGGQVTSLFGGSNTSGTVGRSTITVNAGTLDNIYGGNNEGGSNTESNVNINAGTIGNIFGGGNKATTVTTNVKINNGTINSVYGGGNQAGATTTYVTLNGGTIINAFGGSNQSGNVDTTNVVVNHTNMSIKTTVNKAARENWQDANYNTYAKITLTITNNTSTAIDAWNATVNAPNSVLDYNYSTSNISVNNGVFTFNQDNRYHGINSVPAKGSITVEFGVKSTDTVDIFNATASVTGGSQTNTDNITITNLYGGNNRGGLATNCNLNVKSGNIDNIYGGGNQAIVGNTNVTIINVKANNVYGGGNAAGVNTTTHLNVLGGTYTTNVYGGGNEGTVGTSTTVVANAGTINGSIYAGGNGSTATVKGDTNISISGSVVIGSPTGQIPATGSVFGGGNAATTGTLVTNASKANVDIAGGTIYGNVYGGANTSVVYGTTDVNIGADVATSSSVIKSNIYIGGTVFGGGEANASGSDTYDYSFISVTKGITVNINGQDYSTFDIKGSIFGSGNASSTTGISIINIKNYGTFATPKKNISIQRTNNLTIDNSSIVLKGATDRTNEYSDVLFSLSIIDALNLKNNSTLFLETGSNLLKRFNSITNDGTYETVSIPTDGSDEVRNVDNRIYMYEGKNLNVATNESVTSYGEVYGMTFLGMYNYNYDGSVNTGIYNKSYTNGDTLNWGGVFNKGSYVLGLHKTNHDINVDGFYSNFINEDTAINEVKVINPTPEDSNFYMWVIGEVVTSYEVNLTASKYSTLGGVELPFLDFAKANTTFEVLGFDHSGLNSNVNLTMANSVPRIAASTTDADNNMALVMKSSNTGWLTTGSTTYLTDDAVGYTGTKSYVGENSTAVPSMLFYLYHSKNLATEGSMGTVTITMMAITKIDDLTNETKRLIINVNMSRALYASNDYEAAITAGRKYDMFTSEATNITSKSAVSTYYSLYKDDGILYQNGYHRALVSNFVLPLNTKITMIDYSGNNPKYYYHVINSTDVTNGTTTLTNEGEASYNFSLFEVMGASNSNVYYDDASKNAEYYNATSGVSSEEFVFIVDFADTNITSDYNDATILVELRDGNNATQVSVLGIEHSMMAFNIYANKDAVIDVSATASKTTLYHGETTVLDVLTSYTQSKVGSNTVYDTKYFDSKLGLKLSLIDNNGNIVTGTSLMGLYYEIDGIEYHPNLDGTTRIKIADKVGNTETWIRVVTQNANIATGNYKLRIESFGSPDGIYYGLTASDTYDVSLYIINEIYGLDITTTDQEKIIDGTTGKTLNNASSIKFNINYNSGLANPHIDMKLYRRNYDTVYSTNYTLVDLQDYVTSSLIPTGTPKEYLVIDNPNTNTSLVLILKNNLQTGTYRLDFILLDGTTVIGTVEKYIIIK